MRDAGAVPPVRDDGLQLQDDPAFQKRFWIAERTAWVLFVLIILGALAGLTGAGGPLSRGEMSAGEGRVEYPRVARWQTSDTLAIRFAGGGEVRRLLLSGGFDEDFTIEQILPQPERQRMTAEGLVLEFAAADGEATRAVLDIRPRHPGLSSFALRLDGSPPLRPSVLVLP
ncbi:hypothetical protein [Methylobrevis pamukkalensis]|uniref:Uncharacterized protein n=1 Tax=Methylobrevis pamukkalensis TaxID=1439726 RepID=A0A1E3H1T8_9HYPH|nr:hypothetical protein [Methylobrevis pamukkalensis]ODN70105.1 hypothetical protein A6302_02584 [Methylobrevis pamukkalensis]